MKGDPNKHNKNKYCRFHRDHRHDTNKCYDLKQQIENLIKQGKLRNFLGREVKRKGRRAITSPTWRNNSDYRRNFSRTIFQVKEDIPEGGAECPTL